MLKTGFLSTSVNDRISLISYYDMESKRHEENEKVVIYTDDFDEIEYYVHEDSDYVSFLSGLYMDIKLARNQGGVISELHLVVHQDKPIKPRKLQILTKTGLIEFNIREEDVVNVVIGDKIFESVSFRFNIYSYSIIRDVVKEGKGVKVRVVGSSKDLRISKVLGEKELYRIKTVLDMHQW